MSTGPGRHLACSCLLHFSTNKPTPRLSPFCHQQLNLAFGHCVRLKIGVFSLDLRPPGISLHKFCSHINSWHVQTWFYGLCASLGWRVSRLVAFIWKLNQTRLTQLMDSLVLACAIHFLFNKEVFKMRYKHLIETTDIVNTS